jgi:hypothetical protein
MLREVATNLEIEDIHADGKASTRLDVEDTRPWQSSIDTVQLRAHNELLRLLILVRMGNRPLGECRRTFAYR